MIKFIKHLFKHKDYQYRQLLEEVRTGLEDHSVSVLMVEFICRDQDRKFLEAAMIDAKDTPGNRVEKQLFEYVKQGYYPYFDLKTAIKQAKKWDASEEGIAYYDAENKKRWEKMNREHSPQTGIRILKTDDMRQSKFNGNPNLPTSVAWPLNPQGIELDFLAQIHCSELPPGMGLPEIGTLFFFYDCEEMTWGLEEENDRKFYKVIYSVEPLPAIPRERQTPSSIEDTAEEYLTFELFESKFSDAEEIGEDTKQHQLLGYPWYIQDDDMAPGQILLLQLDSSDESSENGWMWGDCGRLFFWIKPEDLVARNFDRVKIDLECY